MGMFNIFSSERLLKPVRKIADKIEALSEEYKNMSDDTLKQKTLEFKQRYEKGETLDALLPEVFAQVREAAARVIGLKHFYVQLQGGIVLHQGNIAEMKTGEGKTLVATLPAVLNAIPGKGVHIVTVNEYLAKRDSEWMGKVYKYLGYTVGLISREMTREQKQAAYNCDIVYATNNELGFDYLRDNMVIRRTDLVQRELNYAIVDEVDSILIDEARTPLIISGTGDKGTDLYEKANHFVSRLKTEEDFDLDEKLKAVHLTEDGVQKAESHFGVENLSDIENTELSHHINQALKAHNIMFRDRDYVVVDGEVVIVDEFTGRLMIGRRYSDGLHQAIEAKESVNVLRESKTLATITFQNLFRMYNKLSGMTGTAKTEEEEFKGIYNLEVLEIPTHMPMVRQDLNDVIYSTKQGKFNAVAQDIKAIHQTGQPVLVGTVSVADSEYVSSLLVKQGIKHEVLNAKNHMKEAQIVAQAGKKGAVTIATNMAGRGTDILLGGNPDYMSRAEMRAMDYEDEMIEQAVSHAHTEDEEILKARKIYADFMKKHKMVTEAEHKEVVELGGLFIIGTERHESRRIDNQLRGRSGRQGDPGTSKFFVALEDDLMRLFGGERVKNIMDSLVGDESVPLEMGMLTKQIENAQKRIEGNNFNLRKHVLEYDDVMNKQREIIYKQRRQVLMGDDVSGYVQEMIDAILNESVDAYCPDDKFPEEWDLKDLNSRMERIFLVSSKKLEQEESEGVDREELRADLQDLVAKAYAAKEEEMEKAGFSMRDIERMVLLRVVDEKWMDHIDAMDQFLRGISLRALGQRDPVVEYRMEGFDMFDEMVSNIREDTVNMLFHIKVQSRVQQKEQTQMKTNTADNDGPPKPVHKDKSVGRNSPCPCGSGKKYKNCCGKS
jgi:preprotein translocase subunit SecA